MLQIQSELSMNLIPSHLRLPASKFNTDTLKTPRFRNFALTSYLSATICCFFIGLNSVSAQEPSGMQISKQQFIDMSLNMAEKSGELQASVKQQQESNLRQELGQERFEEYQKEELKMEAEREEELASCLGISRDKLTSFKKTMGLEFQVAAIEKCKSKLPDMIDMGAAADFSGNSVIADYTACLEDLAMKETGIGVEKIRNCTAEEMDY